VSTGLVFDERFLRHAAPYAHPENPRRLEAIQSRLEREGLFARCVPVPARPASREELRRVHTAAHLEAISLTAGGGFRQLDPDTYASPDSAEAALLAAGGLVDLAAAVAAGRLENGFALLRPPGHHAEADRAMGFCLFNNVAIAARHLQDRHGVGRVFILDWDVHHGNATQHMFEDDDTVFYFSTHQFPFYPGTGARGERGRGRGAGFTLNVPMRPGSGDGDYLQVFRDELVPALDGFRPEFILVSAGFDAHRDDPLAGMALTEAGYGALTDVVREAAERLCGGRIVSLLEGGYDLRALAASVEAHLRALGASTIRD
jgi:acetoin utilization deacetylase AcuC-like enzyme